MPLGHRHSRGSARDRHHIWSARYIGSSVTYRSGSFSASCLICNSLEEIKDMNALSQAGGSRYKAMNVVRHSSMNQSGASALMTPTVVGVLESGGRIQSGV